MRSSRPTHPIDAIGLTTANRIAYWVVFGVSVLLVCDAAVRLAIGEELHLMRHAFGPAGLLVTALAYRKAVKLAAKVIQAEGIEAMEPHLPVGMDEAARAKFYASINWRRPARLFVIRGRKAMERAIQEEVTRSIQRQS